jgi:hypothetical protein
MELFFLMETEQVIVLLSIIGTGTHFHSLIFTMFSHRMVKAINHVMPLNLESIINKIELTNFISIELWLIFNI